VSTPQGRRAQLFGDDLVGQLGGAGFEALAGPQQRRAGCGGLQGAGGAAQAGEGRDDQVQIGLGGVAQVVAQLQFGRQGCPAGSAGSRDRREGGDLVDFAAPQDHVVVAAEGEGEGGAPGAGSENGDTHGA
jgi:hypothetical protein